jgi:hypothetical protein
MRAGVVNIRKQFRKTKLCSYHLAGRCTFGAQCFYAHNAEDVEASPDLKKTKLCSAWQEGTCDRGANCVYAHGAKELRSTCAVYKTVQCQWYMAGHCSLGQSCRYAHGVEDNHNVPSEESPKRKRNKKKKEKKTESIPELPVVDQTLPINPEFLRGFESFKGQEDILQQIVALCGQLKPDELTPHAGLNPFFPSPYIDPSAFDPSPTAKPKMGYSGSFTPSTVASTNASPHFAPMDLEASVGVADSCLFGMKPLLFDKVHPNGSPDAMAAMNLPVSLFARDGPFP